MYPTFLTRSGSKRSQSANGTTRARLSLLQLEERAVPAAALALTKLTNGTDNNAAPGVFVPPGKYDHAEAQIVQRTNEGYWISVNNTLTAGGFFGGNRVSLTPTVLMRAGETFNAEVGISFNDVNLPYGDFQANLFRTRLSYSFTPRIYSQALLQYNAQTSLWSTNLRFGWLQDANTGLFVVFNDTQDFTGQESLTIGRSLTVKFSRMFDLLR